ncbi:MAG: quinolinate synthase NadA [Spirochaetales bacterium]|nr:quinolinate synthase NadA [Spirochaetales bacterium]
MADKFSTMSKDEITSFINEKREELGDDLNIIGYPGQFGDLLQFADFTGTSREIADHTEKSKAKYLLFTGWRFFTEIPEIFRTDKIVVQANIHNDCPIADAVDDNLIKEAFQAIQRNSKKDVVPLSFIATSSCMRSFTGENEGSTCTPWNAKEVISHYMDRDHSIFFVPANDAFNIITALNLPEEEIFVVDKSTDFETIPGDKKLYAWNVECYIHRHYRLEDIEKVRREHEGIKVVVHKECAQEIIDSSDHTGFVGDIYNMLRDAPDGSSWAVATAHTWVERAAKEFSQKKIVSVRSDLTCGDLEITDPADIARSLETISLHRKGLVSLSSRCIVPDDHKPGARKALERMFEICQ